MQTVVFFDGMCNLCNSTVQFIIKHDTKNNFKFAALQSVYAQNTLPSFEIDLLNPNSFVLLQNGKVYQKSTAALRVAKQLSGLWPLLYVFMVVPRFISDWVYGLVAQNRYKWFGKAETCWVPTAALQSKFLV